jgi:hypothetical protein
MAFEELASTAVKVKRKPQTKTKKIATKINPDDDVVGFIEQTVTSSMLDMSTATFNVPARSEFRTSSLPFCPIRSFIANEGTEGYTKTHYTSIGTAMHTTVQSWLSYTKISSAIMWGSWKCTGCKRVVLNRFKPKRLCECDVVRSTLPELRGWPKIWVYEEVEYNYKGLSGHIDMILFPRPDFAIVCDYKTTSMAKKKASFFYDPSQPSSPSYIAQIRTYCTVLDLAFDLPIRGWCLTNLDRAEPIKKEGDFTLLPSSWDREKSLRWDKHIDLSSKNFRRLTKLKEAVNNEDRTTAKQQLANIVENRPCTSEKTYNGYMKYSFFGKQVCELKEVCLSCKTDRITKKINSILADKG